MHSTSCCAVVARHRSDCEERVMSKLITTTQTIGPFPHEGWRWAFDTSSTAGECVIHGQVLDGDGQPISDAILEAWQPGANGGPHPGGPGVDPAPGGGERGVRLSRPRPAGPRPPGPLVSPFAPGLLEPPVTAGVPSPLP